MFAKCRIFFVFIVACIIADSSQAWTMLAFYHNDAYPGKCYVDGSLILSPGEVAKSPNRCSEIHCRNEDGSAQVIGCGKIMPPLNCRWAGYENINADFPLCCVEEFTCDSPADMPEALLLQNHIREMFTLRVEEKKNLV